MTPTMDERNARIQRQHLERAAYVYVRQSSPCQVVEHLESQRKIRGQSPFLTVKRGNFRVSLIDI